MAWGDLCEALYNNACYYTQKTYQVGGAFAKGAVQGAGTTSVFDLTVNTAINIAGGLAGDGVIEVINAVDRLMVMHQSLDSLKNIQNNSATFLSLPAEQQAEQAGFLVGSWLMSSSKISTKASDAIKKGVEKLHSVLALERTTFQSHIKIANTNLAEVAGAKVHAEVAEYALDLQQRIGRPLMKEEVQNLQGWYNRTQEFKHMPLNSAVLAEVEQINFPNRQFGKEAVERAFACVNPHSSEPLSLQILKQIDPAISTKKYYKHVFLGDVKGRHGSGLHTARNNPEMIVEVKRGPNEQGIYEAYWQKDRMKEAKFSTFVPDKWDRIEYLNRVNEAYYNPVGKACEVKPHGREVFRLRGKDREGVTWEFIVERKNGENKFKSAYPICEEN